MVNGLATFALCVKTTLDPPPGSNHELVPMSYRTHEL